MAFTATLELTMDRLVVDKMRKLLIAEDDQDLQLVVDFSLFNEGYSVAIYNNGVEVLENFESFKPDVVILDQMMPKMDGLTTLQTLKERNLLEDVPVIFLTSKVYEADVKNYLACGARAVIAKPFDPTLLPNYVDQVVDHHFRGLIGKWE